MFSFGSDPEFMLSKNGKFFSAIGIVPGDKYERHEIGQHQYYYDNVMAECAIAPGKNKKATIKNFQQCFQQFSKLVSPYKLVVRASQNYSEGQLEHPEAKKIGCDPEYCAYNLCKAEAPEKEFLSNTLRTAGGHIHLGCEFLQEDEISCYFVIRMLDLFLGVPSIFIDKDRTSSARRKLYGKAGRFRKPEHGVEYRSLGNFWLSSPELVGLVYDICEFTLDFVKNKKHLNYWSVDLDQLNSEDAWAEEDFTPASCHQCIGYDASELQNVINTSDKVNARKFTKLINKLMPLQLVNRLKVAEGFSHFDFYKEWSL